MTRSKEYVGMLLPTAWAMSFLYDENSGLSEYDCRMIDKLIQENLPDYGCFFCVDVDGESEFCIEHDASHLGVGAADCSAYTFEVLGPYE